MSVDFYGDGAAAMCPECEQSPAELEAAQAEIERLRREVAHLKRQNTGMRRHLRRYRRAVGDLARAMFKRWRAAVGLPPLKLGPRAPLRRAR